MPNIFVTGAFGQIGTDLIPALQAKYGKDHVVALGNRNIPANFDGIVEKADIRDREALQAIMDKYQIDTIYHMVSLLSATGEQDPNLAWDVNMTGLKLILDLAVARKAKLFWPSSIAAFGPTTPREMTPQRTVLEPTTIYGVTKVAGELLCQYYWEKYDLDVRSIRYPGLISWKAEPGGGTTDFAVAVFYDGILTGKYTCFVGPETTLPMMYMDDAIRGTMMLMDADSSKISVRTSYNFSGFSFSARELMTEVNKHLPVEVVYRPDHRQQIADSWPMSIDDDQARRDWSWSREFDLTKTTRVMVENLKKKLNK